MDGSDLYIKQIELDWVSGVHVLVWVEELASEQKGLILIHPLLPEGPAVVQPVHWQHKQFYMWISATSQIGSATGSDWKMTKNSDRQMRAL